MRINEVIAQQRSYQVSEFRINAFGSMSEYKRWMRSPKIDHRGMTRYSVDIYENMFIDDIHLLESNNIFSQRKQEASQFSNKFKQFDQRDSVEIKVGNKIALLSATVIPGDNVSRIELSGFVTPKEITKINVDLRHAIDSIEFEDGSRFPEAAEFTTVGGTNITNTIFFTDQSSAGKAYTSIWMEINRLEGLGWEIEHYTNENLTSVEEGWKDWVAGAAMGAAALGGAQDASAKQHPHLDNKPAAVQKHQQVQKLAPKKLLPAQQIDPATNPETQRIANTINQPVAATLITTARKEGITGPELAQLVAQAAHETANFTTMHQKIKHPHDTWEIGRGYFQLTHKFMYKAASQAIFKDDRLVRNPELAADPKVAAQIAVWFWKTQVKAPDPTDTAAVTKKINGGTTGLEDRHNKFAAIMNLMKRA